MYIDCFMIPTSAEHKAEAEAYINFLLDPEICGQNLEYLGYSAPESAAKDYMDEEVAQSEIAYPSAETLARSENFLYLPAETNQLMDSLWLEVKTGGNSNTTLIIAAVVVVLVVLAALVLLTIRKKKRKARRGRSQG
jgi:spermidine/putrescine transport system substrate-binding protein